MTDSDYYYIPDENKRQNKIELQMNVSGNSDEE